MNKVTYLIITALASGIYSFYDDRNKALEENEKLKLELAICTGAVSSGQNAIRAVEANNKLSKKIVDGRVVSYLATNKSYDDRTKELNTGVLKSDGCNKDSAPNKPVDNSVDYLNTQVPPNVLELFGRRE